MGLFKSLKGASTDGSKTWTDPRTAWGPLLFPPHTALSLKLICRLSIETLINTPNVATKAQANLNGLSAEMRALRPDYVQLLQIVAGGRMKGLLDHVRKAGTAVGLPAAIGGLFGIRLTAARLAVDDLPQSRGFLGRHGEPAVAAFGAA